MPLSVLTWNLLHGRSVPPAGRNLLGEFSSALASWEWDVALLQEVPPWWPAILAARCDADHRLVLTSRNGLLPLRRAIATRWPDLIKSNGGGANAILVRGVGIAEHRTLRLRRWPERRWLQGVRISATAGQSEIWFANLHATVHNAAAAVDEARVAAAATLDWASGAPAVLGGDFNVRTLSVEGFLYAGGYDVDHVFAHGRKSLAAAAILDRGPLSDHAPVLVKLAR